MKYLLILLFICGCGYDATCKIESNTNWTAEFEGNTIESYGDTIFNLDDWKDCVKVTKRNDYGKVSLQIDLKNTWFGHEDGGSRQTSTPNGVIEICND